MSDGTRSTLKQKSASGERWQEVRIPPDKKVKRIVLWGSAAEFGGVQLYDGQGELILQTGYGGRFDLRHTETILQDGERLIGTTGYKRFDDEEPRQDFLQFVIGRLE